ncbi:MAG TPA: 1,2-phenylacetyl-CoA epoxidase subunit PaaC [Chitinophagaceae bacterium]|nr:1,2-phenylacetyl-CoA epoxidase subunit PaaC [Chitinophagaceae bacterium]
MLLAPLFTYTLHLADNALMLAQRNAEWTGHGPVLEQDIAITNIALDLIGQARNFYQYAAALYNDFDRPAKEAVDSILPRPWKAFNRSLQEDDLAFLRDEHQYYNLLIIELPKGDWAQTILRQAFFSVFQLYQYEALKNSPDAQLAAIAEKSAKETTYHVRWSCEWVIRLGDGTDESSMRLKKALDELWPFTGELFNPAPYEMQLPGMDMGVLKSLWQQKITAVFNEAALPVPQTASWQTGGKSGRHTEHLGFLLAELQYLQRAYPNAVW